eukprot:gene3164-5907_t
MRYSPSSNIRTCLLWMDGWMDGWIDGWMDRWMDRWIDGSGQLARRKKLGKNNDDESLFVLHHSYAIYLGCAGAESHALTTAIAWTRTPNLLIRSQAPYPIGPRGQQLLTIFYFIYTTITCVYWFGTRTPSLLIRSQAPYPIGPRGRVGKELHAAAFTGSY